MLLRVFEVSISRSYPLFKTFVTHSSCQPTLIKFCRYVNTDQSEIKLNDETIRLLEKLSLVNFENQKYVSVVESAIKFASSINEVNTENVEPLITVLEDRSLKLRDDIVTEGNCQKEILQNATVVDEDYFVAPPGNIPVTLNAPKKQ